MKRVLVVDDSLVYRKILSETIQEIPTVRMSGQARDGLDALAKIELLKPDIITLDVEMPRMNGLETLREINKKWPEIKVVMVSAVTKKGAKETIEALELGAFSFITKPSQNDFDSFKMKLASIFKEITYSSAPHARPATPLRAPQRTQTIQPTRTSTRPSVIAIGISTGGPNSLSKVIPLLPANLPVPIVLVQHMPAGFTQALANSLNQKSQVTVKEAEHGECLKAGVVYIAPGGAQMRIAQIGTSTQIEITDDPAENYCKPSADYLFRSISSIYKERALGVIMTGMGSDGTKGLKRMKRYSIKVIGQDEATSVVYGMPREAFNAGVVDIQVPLEKIAEEIVRSF